MKKLLTLCVILLLAVPAYAGHYDLLVETIVPLDTIVSTAADTTTLSAYVGRSNYLCGPWLLVVDMNELSDSSGLKVYYEYSTDTLGHGYILFDSTITATSTTGATAQVITADTILTADVNAMWYRVRVVGATENDKTSGVTVKVTAVGRNCGR